MLRTAATFPHAGSTAFVAPHGEQVRIIQNNADGSAIVAAHQPGIDRGASRTYRAEPGALFPTAEAATQPAPRRRRAS